MGDHKSDFKALNIKLDELSMRVELLETDLLFKLAKRFNKLQNKLEKLENKI